jgi:hypothetical protein
VATGKVTDACTVPHRHQEFLGFLEQVAAACPRRQLHVTPISGSWLNLVEALISIIIRQALCRGGFPTVADPIGAIQRFIDAWNDRCAPSTWTEELDTIITKATRRRNRTRRRASDRDDNQCPRAMASYRRGHGASTKGKVVHVPKSQVLETSS